MWSAPQAAERILSEILQSVPVPVIKTRSRESAVFPVVGLIFCLVVLGIATLHSGLLILAIPLMAYLFAAIYERPEALNLTVTPNIFLPTTRRRARL